MIKPRILFIIDTLQTGGAEKSLVDIAIKNKDIDSVFITLYDFDESTLINVLKRNGIKVYSFNCKKKYAFNEITKKLVPVIKEIKPNIIHSTLFRSDMVSRKLIKHINVPLINSFVNNSYIKDRYESLSLLGKFKLKMIEYFDRFTAKRVDMFISNSQTIKETNAKKLHIPLSRIKVIYRGRDSMKFRGDNSFNIEEFKRDLKIENKRVFLNISRLLERKGQLDMLKAFKELTKKYDDIVLLIAGEGPYRKILENFIKNNNLQNKIYLLGNRKDVAYLLQVADIFVFPSYYEGLPGALIEAMFAEKLIIASDIAENKECVGEEEALLFKKGDIKELQQKMEKALINGADFDKMKSKAFDKAMKNFEINDIVDRYNKLYFELLSN